MHDADFVRWCFGPPSAVRSTGTPDHLTTLYRFDGGPEHVTAEGGWNLADGFGFHMSFTVVFDHATALFDHASDPELVLIQDGASRPVSVPGGTGYEYEIRHILSAIRSGNRKLDATVEEAVELTRMLHAEREELSRDS